MQVLASYLERTPALEEDLVLGHEVARAYHYTNRTEVLRGGRQQGSPRPLQTDHIQAEDIVLVDKEGGATGITGSRNIISVDQPAAYCWVLKERKEDKVFWGYNGGLDSLLVQPPVESWA